MRKLLVGVVGLSRLTSVPFITACGSNAAMDAAQAEAEENKVDYADDEAMSIIASGLEARSKKIDDMTAQLGTNLFDNEQMLAVVNSELDITSQLKNRQFEDTVLQADVLSYINLLQQQLDVIDTYSIDSMEYADKWTSVYDERSSLLKKFVDEYGLTVEGESAQSGLQEIVRNANAVNEKADEQKKVDAIFNGLTWDKTDDGYGYYTYTCVLENTSDLTFSSFNLTLALYDAEGVRMGETWVGSSTAWQPGEKVRFEAASDIDAAEVKTEVDWYEVA